MPSDYCGGLLNKNSKKIMKRIDRIHDLLTWSKEFKLLTHYPLLSEKRETYRLYVGPNPVYDRGSFDELKRKEIKSVVVLLERIADVSWFYSQLNLNVIHFPIKDFNVPKSTDEVFDLALKVNQALERGNVFIHCEGGRGRTGMIAACIKLSNVTNMDSKEAIQFTRSIIPMSIETQSQEKFISDYYELTTKI